MKNFIDKTIKPFLIIAGLGTCTAGLLVFFPQSVIESMWKLPFVQEYTIFIQHWGMVVLLVGIFMIISAFKVVWRMPILIFATFSKSFYAFLYFFYINHPFSAGFQAGAIMDLVIVIYLLFFFWKGER